MKKYDLFLRRSGIFLMEIQKSKEGIEGMTQKANISRNYGYTLIKNFKNLGLIKNEKYRGRFIFTKEGREILKDLGKISKKIKKLKFKGKK